MQVSSNLKTIIDSSEQTSSAKYFGSKKYLLKVIANKKSVCIKIFLN